MNKDNTHHHDQTHHPDQGSEDSILKDPKCGGGGSLIAAIFPDLFPVSPRLAGGLTKNRTRLSALPEVI